MSELGLTDKVLAIHRALGEAGLAHAFGGALALAYYAVPRATLDIDVNLFVPPAAAGRVIEILGELGVASRPDAATLIERDGQGRLWWEQTPVDLFFAYDGFHDAMGVRARTQPFVGEPVPFLAPEHLLVCKTVFDRRKDWLDIEQMLLVTDALDGAEIRRWLEHLLGPDDPRIARVEALARSIAGHGLE